MTLVSWVWWTAQWPVLAIGLLIAFSAVLYLGPTSLNRDFASSRSAHR